MDHRLEVNLIDSLLLQADNRGDRLSDSHRSTNWSRYSWVRDEMSRRDQNRLPPLVDLDGYCYGRGNNSILREQWTDLMTKYPTKVMTRPNLHLKQSLIGRSLYFAPLEWWYSGVPKHDIFFLCTEELKDFSGKPMLQLTRFLGLPYFNFSGVLQEGAFNVGGHRGYDEEVSWRDIAKQAPQTDDIPLSEEFRKELSYFFAPYNERLFELVGRRCDWS
jgi:hypothetical protein